MRVGLAFIAGMIGWAAMVGLTVLIQLTGATQFDWSMLVGSVITGQIGSGAWILGFVAGLIISGLIALIYGAVFEGMQRSNWRLGVVGGIIHAAIGGVFFAAMSSFDRAMPNLILPPGPYAINYGALTAVAVVVLPLIYGAIVGGMYRPIHIPVSVLGKPAEEHEAVVTAGEDRRMR
ncbi:MAG: hypothetical protein ACM3VT_17295 [Solirubrobacterales bacterium]